MNLKEVLENLAASEIFTFDLVDLRDEPPQIENDKLKRLIILINLGLTDLYRRFTIKEEVLDLKVTSDIKRYKLIASNAVSDQYSETSYILDSVEDPFKGTVQAILRLYSPYGRQLSLNSESTTIQAISGVYTHDQTTATNHLISTPTFNELLFRDIPAEGVYQVVYKGGTPRLATAESWGTIEDVEVDLPVMYLNALCYFVASKMYNPLGAISIQQSNFHEGNNWRAMYEEECTKLKNDLAGVNSYSEVSNFTRGGWI